MSKSNAERIAEKERIKLRLMQTLYDHVGATKMIAMAVLFEHVFQRPVNHKINDTRLLRLYITELRNEGMPICSVPSTGGSGYYIASAGSELEDYCSRLITQGLKKLAQAAKLKKVGLPALVGEIQLNLGMEAPNG